MFVTPPVATSSQTGSSQKKGKERSIKTSAQEVIQGSQACFSLRGVRLGANNFR